MLTLLKVSFVNANLLSVLGRAIASASISLELATALVFDSFWITIEKKIEPKVAKATIIAIHSSSPKGFFRSGLGELEDGKSDISLILIASFPLKHVPSSMTRGRAKLLLTIGLGNNVLYLNYLKF